MTSYTPNRISAGKSDGGQFTHKINGEQDLDLDLEECDYAATEDDYKMRHTAPVNDGENPSMDNIAELIGDDVYDHPEWYTNASKPDPEAVKALRAARGNPDAEISIYRSVPKGVTGINRGDWVSTSKAYAQYHGGRIAESGEFDLIESKVKASTLFSEGNGIEEFGYDGDPISNEAIPMSPEEKYEDLVNRTKEADLSIETEVEENPTIETYRAAVEKNKDLILESLHHKLREGEDWVQVPGENADRIVDEQLQRENTRPTEIGGMRVKMFWNGKEKTVEVFTDNAPGRDAKLDTLNDLAARKLRLKTDWKATQLIEGVGINALNDSGAAFHGDVTFNDNMDGAELQYVEVTYLPSRRSEFIDNHGGSKPIADGWL